MKLKDIMEEIIRIKSVKNGVPYIRFTSNKEGYKVVNDNGHRTEVKMPYIEIRKREKSGRRAALKRRGKQGAINAMRKRSMKAHTWK